MTKQIIVTGGRDYNDWVMFQDVLISFNPSLIIQGGASGADKMAKEWARLNNIECETVEADWDKHGKAAGPIRNKQMLLLYPNALILAFPGGAGTANCVKQAVGLNRIVLMVHE